MKTFAWKILHGRVKGRPSGPNAPVTQGVLAYLDDILIYSKNMDKHVALVRKVLQKLKENQLAVAAHESIFHTSVVEFLGYMVNQDGLGMSERKVESITTWETPRNIKDIQ